MAFPSLDPWAVSDHEHVATLEADLDLLDADDDEQSCPQRGAILARGGSLTKSNKPFCMDSPDGLGPVRGMSMTGRGGPERVRGDVKLQI